MTSEPSNYHDWRLIFSATSVWGSGVISVLKNSIECNREQLCVVKCLSLNFQTQIWYFITYFLTGSVQSRKGKTFYATCTCERIIINSFGVLTEKWEVSSGKNCPVPINFILALSQLENPNFAMCRSESLQPKRRRGYAWIFRTGMLIRA